MRKNRFFLNVFQPDMAREYDKSEKQSLHGRTQKTKLRKALEQMESTDRRKRGF